MISLHKKVNIQSFTSKTKSKQIWSLFHFYSFINSLVFELNLRNDEGCRPVVYGSSKTTTIEESNRIQAYFL